MTLEKIKKTPSFGPNFGSFNPNSGCQFFFFFLVKILALSVTRCHGQLSSCTIPEKTNDPILKKLRDGQTEGYTDEQTEEQTHRQTRVSS